jgi:hypothetical protein
MSFLSNLLEIVSFNVNANFVTRSLNIHCFIASLVNNVSNEIIHSHSISCLHVTPGSQQLL